MTYFITAIGTDSGKTLVSAIVAQTLKADYWKPVQAGAPTDTQTIKELTHGIYCHEEGVKLQTPASPHAAAMQENIAIKIDDIKIPQTDKSLVIEGAGGVLVPLNKEEFVIDIAKRLRAEVIVVSNTYLGSINHTLLTFKYLESEGFKIKGIIFNGEENTATEDIILHHTRCQCLLRIPQMRNITEETIIDLATKIKL